MREVRTVSDEPEEVEDEWVCGESFDHVDRITYEDHETQTWECTNCGAEWYHDKEGES